MNRTEAKIILEAYRSSGEDSADPQFQEALALAHHDPVLGAWFAEQQSLDRILSEKVRAQPVPADLKALLPLARSTRSGRRRLPIPWSWLGAAAAIVLLLGLGGWHLRQTATASARFAMYHQAMEKMFVQLASEPIPGDGMTEAEARAWLVANGGDGQLSIPDGLLRAGIATCKVFDWDGRRVTLLCFEAGGRHSSLFVIDTQDLPGTSFGSEPTLMSSADETTATWRDDGRIYHVISALPAEELAAFL